MAKTDSKFNNNPHFPFTYGDSVENDGERLSDSIVNMLENKQVQSYLGAVAMAVLALGSQARPTNAAPAEPTNAAPAVPNGDVVKPEIPTKKGSAVKLPGPPQTDTGKLINTGAIGIAVGIICLNAAWGTPFMAAGCAGILIAMGNKILGN